MISVPPDGELPLTRDKLDAHCDTSQCAFDTTAELDDPGGFIGQPRVARARCEFADSEEPGLPAIVDDNPSRSGLAV